MQASVRSSAALLCSLTSLHNVPTIDRPCPLSCLCSDVRSDKDDFSIHEHIKRGMQRNTHTHTHSHYIYTALRCMTTCLLVARLAWK